MRLLEEHNLNPKGKAIPVNDIKEGDFIYYKLSEPFFKEVSDITAGSIWGKNIRLTKPHDQSGMSTVSYGKSIKYGTVIRFKKDFSKNKKLVEEVAVIPSKKLRNVIAGYLTRLVKQEKD